MPPDRSISAAVSSARSCDRSAQATAAPSEAKSVAAARPRARAGAGPSCPSACSSIAPSSHRSPLPRGCADRERVKEMGSCVAGGAGEPPHPGLLPQGEKGGRGFGEALCSSDSYSRAPAFSRKGTRGGGALERRLPIGAGLLPLAQGRRGGGALERRLLIGRRLPRARRRLVCAAGPAGCPRTRSARRVR